MTYAKMGRRQSAEAEFLAAIALSPLNLRAHSQLGNLYYDEERYADAAAQFNLSIQCVPTTDASLNLGMAYEQLGELEQAETTFEQAAGLYPWDSRFHFAFSGAYRLNRINQLRQHVGLSYRNVVRAEHQFHLRGKRG